MPLMLAAIAVACAGETRDDPVLIAMKQERIARFVPVGGSLEHDYESAAGSALGKPVRSTISRVFTFPSVERSRAAWQQALRMARSSDWRRTKVQDSFSGELASSAKVLAGRPVELNLAYYRADGRFKFSVRLEQR
jgi:hypothetical protein